MTPKQVQLVETSFKAFVPVAYKTTEEFYDTLFKSSPHLRGMFPEDMREQRVKLIDTLTYAVNGLRYPETLLPVVHDLGKRHKGYKVKPEHYSAVGMALITALERALGPRFTREVKEAWQACVTLIAKEMMGAQTA